MKKRHLFVGVLLATAAFSLAACSGDKTTTTGVTTPTTTESGTNTSTVEKFTVTFNSNGGTAVSPISNVELGSKITAPTAPTKAEDAGATYTFDAWYKDSALTTKFNFDTDTITADTTLYAKYNATAKKFVVTFDSQGGSTVDALPDVAYGSKITAPTAPTKETDETGKYTFAGWYKEASCNNEFNFTSDAIVAATTLYAKWNVAGKCTVTFNVNGGTDVALQYVYAGEKATAPEANPTKAEDEDHGYTFAGWYKDAEFTTEFDFDTDTISTATTIYAKWDVIDKVAVTFNTQGGTEVAGLKVLPGTKITVPNTEPTKAEDADHGYKFAGWCADAECTTEFDFGNTEISTATTIYAKWDVIDKVAVTFDSMGGSAVDGLKVLPGTKITAPTAPTKDKDANYVYTFVGWYKDSSLNTKFDFDKDEIKEATTLYARWNAAANVTMNGTKYSTIKDAFAAIPTDSTETFTIVIPEGTYYENALQYNGSATIHIKGDTTSQYGEDVVIIGHGSNMGKEKERELIEIRGTGNIILENLTLQSDWTRKLAGGNNAQAEVLGTDTKGNTVAYNCSFKSNQDTLRTAGKAWFYGCYVEGDVDFLWMESAGQVALYENCDIVSVYDATASSHASYFTAPRMAKSIKVGKGLVIYNSTVRESDEAKENGQETYMARNPWSNETTYYNQVAYINTTCSDVEAAIWKGSATATDYSKTAIGWKMDQATAQSLGYAGNGEILDATTVANEYSGREAIINRIYNTGKLKYEKDSVNYWDINAFIESQGWSVDADTSKSTLDGEVVGVTTVYKFDGSEDVSSMVDGFKQDGTKTHFVGQAGSTITIPVSGKCYVEVYGYYAGTIETKANTQGEAVMFFNNGNTNSEIENDYIVYDENATSVVITAKATSYITKVVVVTDSSITRTAVSSIEVSASTSTFFVGIPTTLSAKTNPGESTNKSVKWSSSNTNVATIDEYTGKVVFVAAGNVTFTATACDGSGVTGTFDCKAKEATWVEAEWYTTDSNLPAESGATDIGAFDPIGDTKSLKIGGVSQTYTFTNIKGDTITTSSGIKQNSAGKLIIYTTKGNATLTVVTVNGINLDTTPKVNNGTSDAKLIGDPVVNDNGTTTYTYSLDTAGTWAITRGDPSKECCPILYAKCVYSTKISVATELTFGTGGNYESPSLFNITAQVNSSQSNNSQIKGGNIEFTVAAGAQVEVYANWGEAYTINLDDGTTESHDGTGVGSAGQRFYTYTKETKVVIQCDLNNTGHNYFYWIKVTFPTA